jgi:diaminopimelate epimerase
MNNPEYLISAAGGNITAIQVIDNPQTTDWYVKQGIELGARYEKLGAEQSGFLVKDENHFQMTGGEFCGNATRAAAILFSQLQNNLDTQYTVSGFDGIVSSCVESRSRYHDYVVESVFPNMQVDTKEVIANGQEATIVDLGGIVHIVIQGKMPKNYEKIHRQIVEELNLNQRDAVGVIWYTKDESSVTIHPVVWVRSIDSFFYETSCGSGSIAVAKVTGSEAIYQVSNEPIYVTITNESVSLKSRMEVMHNGSPSSSDLF